MGGYSARKPVLASGLFINSAVYAPIFGVSYPLVKDFWNLPEYTQLLPIQLEGLYKAFSGEMPSLDALSEIASRQQAVIDAAYPNGPPIPLVTIVDGVRIALLVMVGVLVLVVMCIMVLVFVKRQVAVFHFSAPIFMVLILLGCLLLLSSLLTYAEDPPNTLSCVFHLWLATLGVGLILGPLLAKTWRVWQIWRNVAKFTTIRITNKDCLKVTTLVLLPILILLTVWTGVNTNEPHLQRDQPSEGEGVIRCDNDNLGVYMGVLFGYLGVLVFVSCALAFLTRAMWPPSSTSPSSSPSSCTIWCSSRR
jgi:7 transmembrane sweet-taste receptor of 3 GCPR